MYQSHLTLLLSLSHISPLQVLFGTNFPQLGFERCVRQVHELQLPPDIQDHFLWRNSARVFKLDMQRFQPRAKL